MESLQYPLPLDYLRKLSRELNQHIPAADAVTDENANQLSALVEALLETARLPHIQPSHRAAACNPLCSILERAKTHDDERIKVLADVSMLNKLFDLYLDVFDYSKPKSMRQVLVAFCSLFPGREERYYRDNMVIHSVTKTLFGILFHGADNSKAKQSLQAISYIVQKEVFHVDELITLADLRYSGYIREPNMGVSFLSGLMIWVAQQDTAQTAGNTICVLLDYGKQQESGYLRTKANKGCPVWVKPVRECLSKRPGALDNFRSHVFEGLFKSSLDDYLYFLRDMRIDDHLHSWNTRPTVSDIEMSTLFTSLQVGLDLDIVEIQSGKFHDKVVISDPDEKGRRWILVPDKFIGRLLTHERPQTRLSALALLVTSPKVTRVLQLGTFEMLKDNLPHFHADTDAHFRSRTTSLTRALLNRLRASTHQLNRLMILEIGKTAQSLVEDQSIPNFELLRGHIDFVQWYLKFLSSELIPTASYQRHISALNSLSDVMKSGLEPSVPATALSKSAQGQVKWPFYVEVLDQNVIRQLFDLIMDPFDDVRHASASILKLGASIKSQVVHGCAQFLLNGEKMMLQSGRADHADGVARVYDLLFERRKEPMENNHGLPEWMQSQRGIIEHLISRLDQTIAAARTDMSTAVNEYPMHGTLSAMRYIVKQPNFYPSMVALDAEELQIWKGLHDHVLSSLHEIWDCVRSTLCVDAPEGYVPEDMEEEPDLNTKDILSYSWRALKEANTLLRAIVDKAHFDVILSRGDFESLGKLCFTQLAELRHRGAFSTVAQTFAVFCARCSRSKDPEIQGLLEKWYEETLRCIRDKGSMITRRSAGLPSLITGILSAAPEGPLFDRVMRDLKTEAAKEPTENANIDGSHLPQVHALNSLKDVFTNTTLSKASEPHMGEALSLAASRLESNVWAIRNCGLMLFRALIDRLLGSGTTQNWKETDHLKLSRLSYKKYPNLLDIITSLLNPSLRNNSNGNDLSSTALEGVFPALQILQRAEPPPERKAEIQALVFKLTASSHWHVRDMAARTIVSLLDVEERVEWYLWLLEMPMQGQNALHGRLLTAKYLLLEHIKYIVQTYSVSDLVDEMQLLEFALIQNSAHLHGVSDVYNNCPFTKSVFMDLEIAVKLGWRRVWREYPSHEVISQNAISGLATNDAELYKHHLDDSLRRRSSAYSLLLDIPWDENFLPPGEIVQFLTRLPQDDPDTFRFCVEELTREWSDSIRKATNKVNFVKLIGVSLSLSTHGIDDVEIHSAVRHAVAELVGNGLRIAPAMQGDVMLNLREPHGRGFGSPSLQEGMLRLRGEVLDLRIKDGKDWGVRATEFVLFNNTVACNLDENMPFPTRYAAVCALSSLCSIWWKPESLSPEQAHARALALLSLIQTIFTALNDDDDEIRDKAAAIVACILNSSDLEPECTSSIMVPLAAAPRLLAHTVKLVASSPRAATDGSSAPPSALSVAAKFAVSRLLTAASPTPPSASSSPLSLTPHITPAPPPQLFHAPPLPEMLNTPVSELLDLAAKEDTALFATERQNLYIDPVREITEWSKFLTALPIPNGVDDKPADAAITSLAEALSKWAMAGIDSIISLANNKRDGVLGWGSQSKITTLVWAMIRVAAVLREWHERGVPGVSGTHVEWSGAVMHVKSALERAQTPSWLVEGPNMKRFHQSALLAVHAQVPAKK
ncbi:putative death-receptor fusion protein-domain-containing protein [Phyllosticta capitalensis]|uniref:Death-receptor fusion protein-domain-containing protein n=1 Tax=Phyllosticta capitalensis TaxID=121624 RepID=A0ABR1YSW2_9PEZI